MKITAKREKHASLATTLTNIAHVVEVMERDLIRAQANNRHLKEQLEAEKAKRRD